jgi:hypothetical protein
MPRKGQTLSAEARAKVSAAKRGKPLTDEHREKLSAAGKGRVFSEEARRKISEARKGKKHTEEAKQKMREARAGREVSAETRGKLSEVGKRRRHTEDELRKMSEANTGRTHTEETRKKLSEINTGRTASAETRRKMSEARRGCKGWVPNEEQRQRRREIAKLRTGWHHSAETRRKMSEAQRGRIQKPVSEETRIKMSEAHKRLMQDPAARERMSERAKQAVAEGCMALPPVMWGADNPRYGKPLSKAHRRRLREARLGRPGTPHTEASRTRISAGNAQAIRDRKRTYTHWVTGPDGQRIPCRSDAELVLVQALMAQEGVVAIRGEDQLPFVSYEIGGQQRLTVADFEVDRADGVTVVVEGKDKTSFYAPRTRARLLAMWGHCQRQQQPFLIVINGSTIPSVWDGPFINQAFMDGLAQRRVRQRLLVCVTPPGASDPSVVASPTSPSTSA